MKSCYKRLTRMGRDTRPWRKIWDIHVPPKIKTFCWQLASSFLPTCDALRMKNVHCSVVCHMCREEEESANHLFAQC